MYQPIPILVHNSHREGSRLDSNIHKGRINKIFKIMELLLLKIAKTCEAENVPLLFVIAPSLVQANKNLWAKILDEFNENGQEYDLSKPNKRLYDLAKKMIYKFWIYYLC